MGSSQSRANQTSAAVAATATLPSPGHNHFEGKHFHIASAADPDMCLTYAADGMKTMPCAESPESLWALKSFDAIQTTSQQSQQAGSNANGDANGQEQQPTDTDGEGENSTVGGSTETFHGYVNRRGFGLHVNYVDIIFLAIVAYILLKLRT